MPFWQDQPFAISVLKDQPLPLASLPANVLTFSCPIQLGLSDFQSKQQQFLDAVAFLAPPPQCVLSIMASQASSLEQPLSVRVNVATFAAYLPVVCPKLFAQSSVLRAQLVVRGFSSAQIGTIVLDPPSTVICSGLSQTPSPPDGPKAPAAADKQATSADTDTILCLAGSEIIGGACSPCAPGTFASDPTASGSIKRCTLCPAGTFIPYASATMCSECAGSAAGSTQCVLYQTQSNIVAIVGGVLGSVAAVASIIATVLACRKKPDATVTTTT